MSIRKNLAAFEANKIHFMRLSIFAVFVGFFVVCGGASKMSAQDGNQYEEPWYPAARFAAKEGGKKEKATITLAKIEDANMIADGKGLTFDICMAVNVKKGRKKAVRQYARVTVFRNDDTMAYKLIKWKLLKTPVCDKAVTGNPSS